MMTVTRPLLFQSCVLALLITCTPALASHPPIGLLGGIQFSWAPFEEPAVFDRSDLDYRSISGVVIGGTIRTSFGHPGIFTFEPGVFYCSRGGASEWDVIGTDPQGGEVRDTNHMEWRISYLTVPLHARIGIGREGAHPYFKVGPEFGLRLSATHEEPRLDPHEGQMNNIEIDATHDIRVLDVGFSVAAGIQAPIGGIDALAQASYYHGLIDVLDPDDAMGDAKLRNRSIAILLGLVF